MSFQEQPFKIVFTHGGRGTMDIHRATGDRLHTFDDGRAHLDLENGKVKLKIEKLTGDGKIKDLGPYF